MTHHTDPKHDKHNQTTNQDDTTRQVGGPEQFNSNSMGEDENRHRSGNSMIEGGQNQYEGEPHEGYGSDQAQSQGGKH